jgi:flagellar biogenesis protein FliO
MLLLLGGLVLPGLAAESLTNAPATLDTQLPNIGFSLLRLVGSFVLVLALFLGGVWCYKNWQRLALQRGRPSKLHVLEIKPLGNRQTLYLVAYDQQRLLVASSPSGVNLLTHLPDSDLSETEAPAQTFVQTLHRALAPKV